MSQLGFKRWIKDGLLPEPIYVDTSFAYKHYLLWEIEAIIPVLQEHYDTYDYFHKTQDETISKIWRALNIARQERGNYGDQN